MIFNRSSAITLGTFRDAIFAQDEPILAFLNGCVNSERGDLGIAGKLLPTCKYCAGYSDSSIFVSCNSCGRNSSNYVNLRAGRGEGIYAVYDIGHDQQIKATVIVLDPERNFAENIALMASKVADQSIEPSELTEAFWVYMDNLESDLAVNYVATITVEHDPLWSGEDFPFGSVFIADSGEGIDSTNAVVVNKDLKPGPQDIYIVGERDPGNNNIIVPKMILVMKPDFAVQLGLPSGKLSLNLKEESKKWADSSVEEFGVDKAKNAGIYNQMIETCLLNKNFWDNASENDHLFLSISWGMFGHQFATQEEIDAELADWSFLSAEQLAMCCNMRGLQTMSQQYLNSETGQPGPLMAKVHKGAPEKPVSSLPRTSSGKGLGLTSPVEAAQPLPGLSTPGLAKFCKECGNQFTTSEQAFCSQCGTKRS